MQVVTFEIPDELVDELHIDHAQAREIFLLGLAQMKMHQSLMLYERGIVSFGRAVEIAGV